MKQQLSSTADLVERKDKFIYLLNDFPGQNGVNRHLENQLGTQIGGNRIKFINPVFERVLRGMRRLDPQEEEFRSNVGWYRLS